MKAVYLFLLSTILFCSCRSTRSMRMELLKMRSNLFYEMTTPEYLGPKEQTLYLDFIDYSNINYYTDIKKKGAYFIPLIVYNLEVNKFRTSLGEGSLTQTYREFLTEALLAECNSSRTFTLIDNQKGEAADSVYHLLVKVVQNETSGQVILQNCAILWFGGEFIEGGSNKSGDAHTNLAITIQVKKGNKCLFEKTYSQQYTHSAPSRGHLDSVGANEDCLNTMTASLSYATKCMVENISQELDLLLDSFN